MKKIKVDCHTHTSVSFDGHISPRRYIETMTRLGMGAACVCDHDSIEGALEIKALNPPFEVIVGEEILTAQGEVIGLFLSERIPPKKPVSWTMDAIHEQGGLVLVPHPFVKIVLQRIPF